MDWFNDLRFKTSSYVAETVQVSQEQPTEVGIVPVVKDLSNMMPVLVPLFALVVFGLSLKGEIEKLGIKVENQFNALNRELSLIRQELKDYDGELKNTKQRVNVAIQAKREIVSQLGKMGINLYVIEENDRRQYPSDELE